MEAPEAAPPSRLLKPPMLVRMGGGVGAAAGLRGDGAAIDVARSAVQDQFKFSTALTPEHLASRAHDVCMSSELWCR